MAYTAKHYQRTWTYDPQGTDFNAQVGRILAQGKDLQSSMRDKAMNTLKSNLDFEKEQSQGPGGPIPHGQADATFLHQTDSNRATPVADGKGFVWVDGKLNTLGPAASTSTATRTRSAAAASTAGQQEATERGSWSYELYRSMSPKTRSMHMWRRVNPGCMEPSLRVPVPSMKDHYQYDPATVERPDKTQHLKKNDFSEYMEVKLRLMHHLANH